MGLVALADLHLGSIRTDYLGLKELLTKCKESASLDPVGNTKFIFVGDLIDAANLYRTQTNLQFPRTMDVQRALVLWLDDQLPKGAEKILVMGNHERNLDSGNLTELLKMLGWKIYELFYCVETRYNILLSEPGKRICFIHSANKRYGGSRIIGRTPSLHFFEYTLGKELGADILVTGHSHKVFNMTLFNGIRFIMLPSFEYDVNNPGEIIGFTPAAWVYLENLGADRIETLPRSVKYLRELEIRNYRFVTEIVEAYYPRYKDLIYEDGKSGEDKKP